MATGEGVVTETIALLREYAEEGSVGNAEKTLALVAAKWIAVEPTAANDPLLADLLGKIRLFKATHQGTDMILFAPSIRPATNMGRRNIMDYFGGGGSGSSSSTSIPDTRSSTPQPQRYHIYCDGACQANGRRGARAGFGGVLQSADGAEITTVSQPLQPAEPQTNQRAELRALQWAFTKAMSACVPAGADIHTDSEYAMKCFTEWGPLWASKGWRKANGADVLHQDILKPMWDMWKMRGSLIRLHHVSAHTGGADRHSRGNARADELAVASLRRN